MRRPDPHPEDPAKRGQTLPLTWFAVSALVVLGGAACGAPKPSGPPADGSPADDGGAPPDGGDVSFLERLASPADFALVQGEGGEVKYLGRVDGRTGLPPVDKPCMFQNTARYAGHITFLRSHPELANLDFNTYLDLVMKNQSRQLWGGELKFFASAVHPRGGGRGVLAYFVYADDASTEALTLEQLAEVDARLKACVPYAKDLLVLVAATEAQAAHFVAQTAALQARGIDTLEPRLLRPGGGAEGYSLGENYGYLRVVPPGQAPGEYGPRDVLVTQGSAEDLSLVAGLITALPQNLHSHVNLRLREKMIPNASVPDIFQNQVVSLLDGKLVHLVVGATTVRIEPALLATAMAFWDTRRPAVQLPPANLAETELRPLGRLGRADVLAYGSKAANLGELGRALPAANVVTSGFGVPFSVYRDFMRETGVESAVEALLSDPKVTEDSRHRRASLAALRKAIERAPLPPALHARLAEAARAAFGDGYETIPLRFRSSSNVEDGETISGAGLHASSRGCFADDADGDAAGPSSCLAADERAELTARLEARSAELAAHPERAWLPEIIEDLANDLGNERAVARALKKVYASLWNDRAFEERAYWGIDQRTAQMGVLVEPSFVLERANAVVVTNLDGGAGAPIYRVISQRGDESVVQPADPSLIAETVTFRRDADSQPSDVQILTRSSLSPAPLWPEGRLRELAALVFAAQDHFAVHVFPELAQARFDLEIKVTRDDRIVLKQARPYVEPN